MKKWFSLALALMLVLTLAACGGDSGKSGSSGSSNDGAGSGDVYANDDGYGEGRLGDTVHSYFLDFTVNSAYTTDSYAGFTPAEGNQVLVVNMTVKNTFNESITMWDDDFWCQWSSGQEAEDFAYAITEDGSDLPLDTISDEQLPGEYDLSVSEERTGDLVFEVPAGDGAADGNFEKDFSIAHQEYFVNQQGAEEDGDTFFVFFTANHQ